MKPAIRCPDCGFALVPKTGKFGTFYGCIRRPDCDGKFSGLPTATPAKKAVRVARTQAHKAFDAPWRSGKMTRAAAYAWMRRTMGIKHERDAHIGRFGEAQCRRLVKLVGEVK